MIRRYELSDVEWLALEPFPPDVVTGGRPRSDDRRLLNGIVWKIRSGAAWRDVPQRYGSWQTVYTRFRRWALDGTFAAMLAGVQADVDAAGARRAGSKGGTKKRTKYRITPLDDPEED